MFFLNDEINNLLNNKASLKARLNLLPYDGTVEIKTIHDKKKYLYIRKKILGKATSKYVDIYSDELYTLLLKNTKEAKELKKQIRKIDVELAKLGYVDSNLNPNVVLNVNFARSMVKQIIYDQAILEGVATTFPDTETIIENGIVNNMTPSDIQKITNLKRSWEFILDDGVIQSTTDYYISSNIAKFVNDGFFYNGGDIRKTPVKIGGTSYIPPIPEEDKIKESINKIVDSKKKDIDKAIELCLLIMKKQVYNDGNKRTGVILANHYLISKGKGLLIIPFDKVEKFKKLLVGYYEGKDKDNIHKFLQGCWNKLK